MIRPGSVEPKQIPGWNERAVRGLKLEALLEQMQGFASNTLPHRLCEVELRRREGWVARWALAISMLALLVSFSSLFLRRD